MEQCMKSGRSNASSPATASLDSSTNSRGSSQSLNDININSLMSTLLHDVSADNLSAQHNSTCSHNGNASNRCTGCNDINCDICFPSQLLSSSEFGYEHYDVNSQSVFNHGINISNFVSSGLSTLCEVHRDAQRLYCQTCSKPLCGECGVQNHYGHVIMDFMVAVEDAEIQAKEISKEAALAIDALKEELDVVEVEKETLEQKLLQAEADVKLWKREVTAALEARERELLARIEKGKRRKAAKLKAKYDDLRNKIDGLYLATDKLMNTMESESVDSDLLSLLAATDMVAAETFKIDHYRQFSFSQEDSSIDDITVSFDDIVDSFLNFVANFGEVVEYNATPICGRVNSLQTFIRQTALCPVLPMPKETTPSNPFSITIRLNGDADRPVRPLKIIGNDCDVMDNLCRPWGVACDREGHIVVADRSNNRVQIYRQDGSFVRRFGTHGTAPGQFDRPAGVAVDARRRIVVADKDNHRIQILTMQGQFLLAFGEKGGRCGQFNYPWDVAVNSECQIAVSDTRNHRVQLFSAEGVFLRKYGFEAAPNMWKHFDSPRGVAFNPAGNVVITDFNNHRVLIIDADFMDARVFQAECPGDSKLFQRPQGLVIDDEGNIIVADSRNHRIQIFDKNGTLRWKFGNYGKGEAEMDCPAGIALCPDGKIAVVDFGNNRVLLF